MTDRKRIVILHHIGSPLAKDFEADPTVSMPELQGIIRLN